MVIGNNIPHDNRVPVRLLPNRTIGLHANAHYSITRLRRMITVTKVKRPPHFFTALGVYNMRPRGYMPLTSRRSLGRTSIDTLMDAKRALMVARGSTIGYQTFTRRG